MWPSITRNNAILSGSTSYGAIARQYIGCLFHLMPKGRPLPKATWESRHRGIVILLWLHVIGIACAEAFIGHELAHSLIEVGLITAAALLAGWSTPSRTFRAVMASLGLVTTSAVLVHLSGGYIEMHFHFFVVVIIIALYQEWTPFLLTIGYVVLHHGLIGTLIPTHVYNHPVAWANPWQWAAIHAIFVTAASIASLITWRNSEADRTQTEATLEALAVRNKRLEVVRAVTEEITRELDLTALLELITQRAAELIGAPSSAIYLWDKPAEAIIPQAWYGLGDWMRDVRFRMGEGIPGAVGQCREGMIVNDYRSSPYASPLFIEHTGITAVLAAPLLYRGRLLGVITLNNGRTGRHFTEQDSNLLGLFAAQTAIAIQNARLYENQAVRATRLHTLTRLNQLISSSLDMGAVLREIAQAAATLMNVPFVRIFTADEATQTLEVRASSDDQLAVGYPTKTMRYGERSAGWVAQHRRALHIPDVFVDERVATHDWLRAQNLRSLFAVPILHHEVLLGVLVMTGRQPFQFAPDEQALLDTFVAQAAVAIRNASLYEALRSSDERTRLILENALDAVITIDQLGHITDWNPQAEATFGWSRQEAIGRSLGATIIPAKYREAHQRGVQRFLATGKGPVMNKRIEINALYRDGREFPVELAISPMQVGQTFIFSAFIRDITERKRAEADLQQAKDAAEAAAKAKGEFLANMSHEIRTPMNGILGMTELALDTTLTPDQREYLTIVKASADGLLSILNDILDFSKIEAGKLALDAVPFALRDSLGASLKTLALRAHEKGLELAYTVRPEVPDTVVGDPGRLRQILVNLVGNAVKFTEHGEVVVEVEATSAVTDSVTLHVAVKDTGIGIPTDKQHLILEPFTQADGSMTRKYGGTGLGLAISKQLVELMGGRLWLESDVGGGSTFHFTTRFGVQPTSVEPQVPAPVLDARQLPVLVVDDNSTNRRILHDVLAHWQMQPTAVDGGKAALAVLTQAKDAGTPFPLVLLDAQMPEMDGFTLAARIRQDPALVGATILMLSSANLSGDAERCRELGIPIYLTKPIIQSALWDAIMTSLRRVGHDDHPVPPVPHPVPFGSRQGVRILLAEDNTVNQTLAVRMLEKRGHQVEVVGTGKEALTALARQPFDLVLMDVQMPELDGFEATAAIRAREREIGGHLPIIAMTAHAMKGDQERCLAAGMDGYVAKPMKAGDLYAAIDRLLTGTSTPDHATGELPIDLPTALCTVGGDQDLLVELVETFQQDYPLHLISLREACSQNKASQLERSAHSLKGAVAVLGATTAYTLAAELETMGRDTRLDGATALIEELESELTRIVAFFAEPSWQDAE
jgi:PAS domain S-box-containing protein